MFKSGANSRVHSFPLRLFTITLVMAILALTGCQTGPQKA
jgi:hypothetical protein